MALTCCPAAHAYPLGEQDHYSRLHRAKVGRPSRPGVAPNGYPGLRSASGGLVGLLLTCCLLILAGMLVSPTFRWHVWPRGKLGILHLGYEYYLSTPEPLFTIQHCQTGYA